MFKKEDLKSGMMAKTREGKIVMYMDLKETEFSSSEKQEGIFLGEGGLNISSYKENLLSTRLFPKYDIIEIRQPNYPVNLNTDTWCMTGKLLWERQELTQITSLDQLEEVRKELCKKYDSEYFYITNQTGEWEIRNNNEYFINNYRIYGDGYYTFDVNIDLEKEGYELKIS